MPKVIYAMGGVSADGYVVGPDGKFDWSVPDEELHRFHNEQTRALAGHLLGRRLYETMVYWETAGLADDDPEVIRDFGSLWRAADKIVFSETLTSVTSARTRTERDFDQGLIRQLKQGGDADLSVGARSWPGRRSPPDSSTRSSCSSSP